MKGGRGGRSRCCHRCRLSSKLLLLPAAAVVIATTRTVVGAAVAGRMLLRLLLLLLLMVVRWAGSQSLTSVGSVTSAVAVSISTPPQMRTINKKDK